MLAFTVMRDELKTYLGSSAKGYEEGLLRGIGVLHPICWFSAKGYEEVLLRGIGVLHPIVIYESGGKCFFLRNVLKVNVQQKS